MSVCQRFVVRGHVQAVGFRAATQRQARRLGLTGWVRNDSRGFVELLACGELGALQVLQRWLQHGPEYARVSQVECHHCDPVTRPDFGIV